jgi:hypothetical protein
MLLREYTVVALAGHCRKAKMLPDDAESLCGQPFATNYSEAMLKFLENKANSQDL